VFLFLPRIDNDENVSPNYEQHFNWVVAIGCNRE